MPQETEGRGESKTKKVKKWRKEKYSGKKGRKKKPSDVKIGEKMMGKDMAQTLRFWNIGPESYPF